MCRFFDLIGGAGTSERLFCEMKVEVMLAYVCEMFELALEPIHIHGVCLTPRFYPDIEAEERDLCRHVREDVLLGLLSG